MPVDIHPTAVVSPKAQLGEDVQIGPYAIIEQDVTIGDRTVIGAQAVVMRWTSLGNDNQVSPLAALGGPPQDIAYRGEETRLVIGEGNIIREFVTMHRGTVKGGGITRVGNGNMFMNYSHIGHDSQLADEIILTNSVQIAGHVEIGRAVVIGGSTAILQFLRIGEYAFLTGLSPISQDSPPFIITDGRNQLGVRGLNIVGLKRNGFDKDRIKALRQAYKALFKSKDTTFKQRLAALDESELSAQPDVARLIDFVKKSKKGVAH